MINEMTAIPDRTLEFFAKGFFNEACLYGFGRTDYVRFVNHLLDLAIAMKKGDVSHAASGGSVDEANPTLGGWSVIEAGELPIAGEQVVIRAYDEAQDRQAMQEWMSANSGRQFMPSIPDSEAFLAAVDSRIGVVTLPDGASIGAIAYIDHDLQQRRAELRLLAEGRVRAGPGLGREAVRLWIAYGIRTIGLRKIILSTLDTSVRNIRLNESLGFEIEGILRDEIFVNGRYRDVLRMGLNAARFDARQIDCSVAQEAGG